MNVNVTPSCPRCRSNNLVYMARGRMDGGKWTKYFWVSCADCGAEVGIMDRLPPEPAARDDTTLPDSHWLAAAYARAPQISPIWYWPA